MECLAQDRDRLRTVVTTVMKVFYEPRTTLGKF